MSAAHDFAKERRVSGALKNDERVNALFMFEMLDSQIDEYLFRPQVCLTQSSR